MTELWEGIACPVLIVNAGEGYPFRIGQDGTLRHFRRAEAVVVPEAGHWLHHDRFDEFLHLVRAFLARQAGAVEGGVDPA
jgi:pimeloyl-ACP methyl ester carboxylesterase